MTTGPGTGRRERLENALLAVESAARATVANGGVEALRERLRDLDEVRTDIRHAEAAEAHRYLRGRA